MFSILNYFSVVGQCGDSNERKWFCLLFKILNHFLFSRCLGSLEALLVNLSSPNEKVRSSVAAALGYLSFDRTASRLMLQACRNTPELWITLVTGKYLWSSWTRGGRLRSRDCLQPGLSNL